MAKRVRASRRTLSLQIESLEPRMLLASDLAIEFNNVGHLLTGGNPYADPYSPPRVVRYDIENETWLAPITLPGTHGSPSALHVDADGIYVAYAEAGDDPVYRYNSDGSGETHLFDAPRYVHHLHSDGDLLFGNYSGGYPSGALLFSVDKTTNTVLHEGEYRLASVDLDGSAIAGSMNRIFGVTDGSSDVEVMYIEYDEAGNLALGGISQHDKRYREPEERVWIYPDESKVIDASGTVLSTDDLSFLYNIPTTRNEYYDPTELISDVVFDEDGNLIVLRGMQLDMLTVDGLSLGSHTLNYEPDELLLNENNIITFTYDSSNFYGYAVGLEGYSEFVPPATGEVLDPTGWGYTPDHVEVANDGTILLFSISHRSIFRWNPISGNYAKSIPLVDEPVAMSYSSELDTIYVSYYDSRIRKIDLSADAPTAEHFVTLSGFSGQLEAVGPYLFVVDSSQYGSVRTYAADGTLAYVERPWYPTGFAHHWNETQQRLYSISWSSSSDDVHYRRVILDEANVENPVRYLGGAAYHLDDDYSRPRYMSVAPDGSAVVFDNGLVHDGNTCRPLEYSLDNKIVSGAWLASGEFVSMREDDGNVEFQKWSAETFELRRVKALNGTPISIHTIDNDRLLAITIDHNGPIRFTVLDSDLRTAPVRGDFTGDGLIDADDIDALFAAIDREDEDLRFDLADDGAPASMTDMDTLIEEVLNTRYGDANLDGIVNFYDFAALAYHWEESGGWAFADFDGDGRTAIQDYFSIVTNWGYRNPRTPSYDLVVTASDGTTIVDESETTDTIEVSLNAAPNSDVVIAVSSGDTDEATVDRSTLRFTPDNWDVPQPVVVTGVDDLEVDDTQTSYLTFAIEHYHSDPALSDVPDHVVSVQTTDNESVVSAMIVRNTAEFGQTGYYLVSNNPRIERFDFESDSWLDPLPLPDDLGEPTVLTVTDNELFVAYGSAIYRYNLDGSGQTLFMDMPGDVVVIRDGGDRLFVEATSSPDLFCIDKATQVILDDAYEIGVISAYVPSLNRLYGLGSIWQAGLGIAYLSVDEAGQFGPKTMHEDARYYSRSEASWLFPDQSKIVDDAGVIVSTDDLSYVNRFATSITDIAFFGEGDIGGGDTSDGEYLILDGDQLKRFNSEFLPTGSLTLDYSPDRIVVQGSNVITISGDFTAAHGVIFDSIPLSSLVLPTAGEPVDPVGQWITPERTELASDGTLLFFSERHQSIFRWDPVTQQYSQSIPLVFGEAQHMTYAAETNTAYVSYESGLIAKLDLSLATPVEVPFATLRSPATDMAMAGDYLFTARHPQYQMDIFATFDADGNRIDTYFTGTESHEYVWSDMHQTMYSLDYNRRYIDAQEINADGATYPGVAAGGFGDDKGVTEPSGYNFENPVVPVPDGSALLHGSGQFFDPYTFDLLPMSLPNGIYGAVWLGNGDLYTHRFYSGDIEVQRWDSTTYEVKSSLVIDGSRVSITKIDDDRFVVVTNGSDGYLSFTVLDAELQVIGPAVLTP